MVTLQRRQNNHTRSSSGRLPVIENDEDDNMIESIVGAKKMKFVPLIHHLIVCEDNYYTN